MKFRSSACQIIKEKPLHTFAIYNIVPLSNFLVLSDFRKCINEFLRVKQNVFTTCPVMDRRAVVFVWPVWSRDLKPKVTVFVLLQIESKISARFLSDFHPFFGQVRYFLLIYRDAVHI